MAALINNMADVDESLLPTIDIPSVLNCPYDVYVGCVTGYLKGCQLSTRVHFNLNSLSSIKPCHEIKCMCWSNYSETDVITGLRDNRIIQYSWSDKCTKSIDLSLDASSDVGVIRGVKSHEQSLFAAFSNGLVRCKNISPEDGAQVSNSYSDIIAGKDLFCMDHNRHLPSQILTGGKEHPLKIWDLTSPETPIFTAKNVKNDWLNLRVPVWVTRAEFCPQGKKVLTGTAKAHIRVYDPSSTQRRPAMDIDTKETSPITALAIRPLSEFQVFAGTGKGTVIQVDTRMKSVVKNFKGVKGGVTDMKFHPILSFFAVTSVDRYVYCFDADASKQKKSFSVYACSQLNCLLFPSESSFADNKNTFGSSDTALSIQSEIDKNDLVSHNDSVDEGDADGLWDSMEVVETKTKRKNPISEKASLRKKKKK